MDSKQWRLPVKRLPTQNKVDRSIVWNNVHLSYEQTLFGQVQSMEYSPDGTMFGCTSTNQVLLLRIPHSDGCIWNEQNPRPCHSLRFRDDGKLTIQSVEQRVVVKSTETAFERYVQGHTRDVRDAIFVARQTFASGSDDCTVRVWDLVSEQELAVGNSHTDYVRSLALHSEGCFYSGSYDHTINLWDVRIGLNSAVSSYKPSADDPVDAMLYIPALHLLACGTGDVITVYDARHGRADKPLFRESHHTKAVTSLAYSPDQEVLVSGSLDQRVKFTSLKNGVFDVVSTRKYSSPVTTLAVHPHTSEFAVGMATGRVEIYAVDPATDQQEADGLIGLSERKEAVLKDKVAVARHFLASYQYHKAMKTALYARHDDVLISVLEELHRRGALHVALSSHNDRSIVQLLRFAVDHVDIPQLTDLMVVTLDTIFEIYGPAAGRSEFFHRELMIAYKRLGDCLSSLQSMEEAIAVMEMIVEA